MNFHTFYAKAGLNLMMAKESGELDVIIEKDMEI